MLPQPEAAKQAEKTRSALAMLTTPIASDMASVHGRPNSDQARDSMTTHIVPQEARECMKVSRLEPGEWCIDVAGDYWGREYDGDVIVCFFRRGGFTTSLDPEAYVIAEMLPKGTVVSMTVGE